MKSNVFFSDLKVGFGKTLPDKLAVLLDRANVKAKINEKTWSPSNSIRRKGKYRLHSTLFLEKVVDEVKQCKGKPFLTDTNTSMSEAGPKRSLT